MSLCLSCSMPMQGEGGEHLDKREASAAGDGGFVRFHGESMPAPADAKAEATAMAQAPTARAKGRSDRGSRRTTPIRRGSAGWLRSTLSACSASSSGWDW